LKKLKRHLFVCTNVRAPGAQRESCGQKASEGLVALFKESLKKRGIAGEIRAQKAGCLDVCEWGPSVVVYPDAVWYGRVQPQDVEEIVQSHLIDGLPVERLRIPGR
jgi:(2Fe-2S) ferredoxin